MSKYSENYNKVYAGYVKIQACIDSCKTIDQLDVIETLVNNWVNLINQYCDEVYRYDKKGKKWADQLGEAGRGMFDDIKELYQATLESFKEREYVGVFKPVRIKSLQEYADIE